MTAIGKSNKEGRKSQGKLRRKHLKKNVGKPKNARKLNFGNPTKKKKVPKHKKDKKSLKPTQKISITNPTKARKKSKPLAEEQTFEQNPSKVPENSTSIANAVVVSKRKRKSTDTTFSSEQRILKKPKITKNETQSEIKTATEVGKKKKRKKKKNSSKNEEIQEDKSQQSRIVVNNCNLNLKKLETILTKSQKNVKTKCFSTDSDGLRDRMMARLRASRFRFLNETLYNNQSSDSKKYFKEDPEAFKAYHEGYKQQVQQWPLNPVDVMIASILKMPKDRVIADFGCGEAKLANSVPQVVHSFDLVAVNDKVKACDMAHTPLLTNGVDVVVFCLSLMGQNLGDYILEANRVLKKNGILKIAEVESRFDNIEQFYKLLEKYGFTNSWSDLSHNLFYFMDFVKERDVSQTGNKLPSIVLKSCLYKKR